MEFVQDPTWEPIKDNLFAIGSSHPCFLKCKKLKKEILEVLRSSHCERWFVISVLNGEREETAEPTVLVIANENVDMPYESKDDIKVKFEQGEIGWFSPADADNNYYEQPIRAGSSCSGENDPPGTVGGFFTLQDHTVVGLTNAHVVKNSATLEGRIHQPAVADYTFKIQNLKEEIAELSARLESEPRLQGRVDIYQGQLTQYEYLQRNGGFLCGNYMHGQQVRSPERQTLDYAIFSIDPRRPDPTNQLSVSPRPYPSRLQPPNYTLAQLTRERPKVFKVGRSTGFTVGFLGSDKGCCKLDGLETEEYTAMGRGGQLFAKHGDSGSLLCDAVDGAIYGLIWGGCLEKNLTFVTPIDIVFQRLHENGYDLTLYTN